MVLSRAMATFNRKVGNTVLGRIAPWMPGFAMVHHPGRKSGRAFQTPVNAFRRGDGYVFALTYGSGSDWVKNTLAAGEMDLKTRRRTVHLVDPQLTVDPTRSQMPPPVRVVLRLIRVDEFLSLRLSDIPVGTAE